MLVVYVQAVKTDNSVLLLARGRVRVLRCDVTVRWQCSMFSSVNTDEVKIMLKWG